VLDRNINVGDTVVDSSSNSSASIFTLAENLREMQIEATVGELEVASIYRGQAVRFTLESMRGRTFSGVVENIRMVPIVTNNIVTYMVIISVENHDGSLFPGMTCAVNFVVEQSENILMVANAALRYQPSSLNAEQIDEMVFYASLANMNSEQQLAAIQAREQAAARNTGQSTGTGIVRLLTGTGQNNRPAPRPASGGGSRAAVVLRNLWLVGDDGKLEVIQIRTGISNGQSTEVFLEKEFEGRQVILRERL
jgi:HlyD family secretion protein